MRAWTVLRPEGLAWVRERWVRWGGPLTLAMSGQARVKGEASMTTRDHGLTRQMWHQRLAELAGPLLGAPAPPH
jgi:hypothetical protein